MTMEKISTYFELIIQKLNPSDLLIGEHRSAISARIEQLLNETGLTRQQFSERVRMELNTVKTWLSGTRDVSLEMLTEICQVLHISLGDLVLE